MNAQGGRAAHSCVIAQSLSTLMTFVVRKLMTFVVRKLMIFVVKA
jgi:hypothetical protein